MASSCGRLPGEKEMRLSLLPAAVLSLMHDPPDCTERSSKNLIKSCALEQPNCRSTEDFLRVDLQGDY